MKDPRARAFIEEIVAHPDDDTPRLIFADWLSEHGDDARAEFIRVQVERASLPHWEARQVPLRLREQQLLNKHGQKWKGELPTINGVDWNDFRRGFVATATFDSFADLGENATACWAATPLEGISIRWPRHEEAVENIAPIAGLRELAINARVVDFDEVDLFANAPLLSTLRVLDLRECSLAVEGFRRVLAAPHLHNLTALQAPYNNIGNEGIQALPGAKSLTSLTELDLCEHEGHGRYNEDPVIRAAGMKALAAWSGLARLRCLKLSGNHVGKSGLRSLLRSPRIGNLKELHLRSNALDGKAMQEFGGARAELQLDVLDLGENALDALGASELALAPCLHGLKDLRLDVCELSLVGARWLVNSPLLASLRCLNINHNSFGPEGLYRLLEKKPPALHTLVMMNNDLGDEGAAHVAESPASNTLLELDLSHNALGDQAAKSLAKTKHLRNLLVLRLDSNRFSKPAMKTLTESPLAKRLVEFST